MAFTVKATYHGETRKFALASSSFPSYDELFEQLFRVFSHGHAYYLSRLIFSPAPGKQILIGAEVHNKKDYDAYAAPYRGGVFPGAMLKFNVNDEMPHKASRPASVVSASTAAGSSTGTLVPARAYSPAYITTPSFLPPMSMGAIPPPPILFPSPPRTPLVPMDVDTTPVATPLSRASSTIASASTVSSCCEVSQKKEELQGLLTSFIRDFDRIATSTFGSSTASTPAAPTAPQKPPKPWKDEFALGTSAAAPRSLPVPPKATGTRKASEEAHVVHRGVLCDGCNTTIKGSRHKCMQCRDFDYCSTCLNKADVRSKHATNHKFICIAKPSDPIHRGILCDSCNVTIAGVRHKCLDCRDFDLCTTCISGGAIERMDHNPFHQFYEINTPGRVVVHNVYSGVGENTASAPRAAHHAAPVPPPAPVAPAPPPPATHAALCDLCDSNIVGDRYKCLSCPDFDACASCYKITAEQHPLHGFVRVRTQSDIKLQNVRHAQGRHGAWCNVCKKVIVGVRYKCMHPTCPDFDLCSNCESHPIPIHPLQHPLLKMKTIDTVIPTVYRVGSTVMIPSPSERVKAKQTAAPVELTTPPVDVSVPEMPRDIEMTGIAIAEPERVKTVVYTGPLVDVSIVSDARSQLSHLLAPAVEATTGQDQTLVDTSVPEIPATPSTLSKEALLASPVQAPADAPVSQGSTRQQMLDIISRSEADLVEQASSMTMPGGMPEEASPVLRVQNLTLEEPIVAPQMSARVDAPRVSLPIATFTPTLAVPSPKLLAAEVPKAATPPPPAPAAPLRAAFVSDLNIPDGQIFPPGAEFVKSWVLSNDGEREWPEKTELRYVAGDRMGDEGKIVVGGVGARTTVTVSTPELKAPETPGRYVAYWRLFDGEGCGFGTSVWIDITVAEPSPEDSSSGGSLAASSVIMPHAANPSTTTSPVAERPGVSRASTTTLTDDTFSIAGSDISLVDAPSPLDSDDEDAFRGSRGEEPMEYVVLYEEPASDEE